MNIGVLGTGTVGTAIATRLVELGHDVMMGARSPDNEKAVAWAAAAPTAATNGTFADAAAHGELVFNCTPGSVTLAALELAGADHLNGKVLVDISNPLDFSKGMPPTLTVANTDSIGEQVQRAYPSARVVKALNTMTAEVMVHPERVPGDHILFVSGDDADAKATVMEVLGGFGWPPERIMDLGDITGARGMEMYVVLWVRMMGALGTADFNLQIGR